mmetsp:Transcript_23626/g.40642  ORF Transcript_23626/g.40642 Transcript_23626/m.40642 type:complete len:84 (-) Transcript_23626:664-915(-)
MSNKVLTLYKQLLRTGKEFRSVNLRSYTLRRVKEDFREHKHEQDAAVIAESISNAEKTLEMLKRQVVIFNLYQKDHSVMENVR